jgi:MOSC domain-containing protein YiiM
MAMPKVHSTHISTTHSFSKSYSPSITLIAGHGVEGDCHSGQTIQQTRAAKKTPAAPNLRQVHLIPYELFASLANSRITISPGELGENITTYGIDLHGLSRGSYLYFGDDDDEGPIIQITGLRNPGKGVEKYKEGLSQYLKWNDPRGNTVMRCGVMGIVLRGGEIEGEDNIRVVSQGDFVPLGPV